MQHFKGGQYVETLYSGDAKQIRKASRSLRISLELAQQGVYSGASKRGREIYGPNVEIAADVPQSVSDICFDAETSGGILVCVQPDKASDFCNALGDEDLQSCVGEVVAGEAKILLN